MNAFHHIMEAMDENKQFFIDSYLNRAREAMRRLSFTPNVGASHLVVQRRLGYNIIQNRRTTKDKGRQIIGSTNAFLEERPP